MKHRTLRDCKDEEIIKISSYWGAATYILEKKEGRYGYICSEGSGRTYKKLLTTKVY